MNKTYDPRMHSAEHILNQTMDRMLACGRCFNAHIERKKSKCDYRYNRNISDAETAEIEQRVNSIIAANLDITESHVTLTEASQKYNLDKLPSNTGDTIRIIKIGDYDACPCIGTHVGSTKEIGAFKITSRSFDKGVLRIRFKLSPPTGVKE